MTLISNTNNWEIDDPSFGCVLFNKRIFSKLDIEIIMHLGLKTFMSEIEDTICNFSKFYKILRRI